jgi:anaerobic carbon-monoxide dehydrogenase iron sulfur subunit
MRISKGSFVREHEGMGKLLFINFEKCVGCMSCVLACSLQHGDTIGPSHSMIFPVGLRKQVINIPVVCRQCAKPLCADACPMGAISRNPATGALTVDSELCIACGSCMMVCPIGGISVSTEAGHAMKCDLCGGDPLCVKFCGYDAIEYLSEEDATVLCRKRALRNLPNLLNL